MKISEPVFIRKTEKRGYQITGRIPVYGTIRRYGLSEEEAKKKFFEACDGKLPNGLTCHSRQKALLTILFATLAGKGALLLERNTKRRSSAQLA